MPVLRRTDRPSARLAGAVLLVAMAACSVAPPRTGLCYTPSGPTNGWSQSAEGRLQSQMHGAAIEVDLSGSSTRIGVTVQNPTTSPIEVRMGGEGVSPSTRIGELLQRPLQLAPAGTGSDYVPYASMQPMRIEAGWRATFYLDSPLGREPSYGQFFVFTVEAQRPGGPVERRSIPLAATNIVADRPGPASRRGTGNRP